MCHCSPAPPHCPEGAYYVAFCFVDTLEFIGIGIAVLGLAVLLSCVHDFDE